MKILCVGISDKKRTNNTCSTFINVDYALRGRSRKVDAGATLEQLPLRRFELNFETQKFLFSLRQGLSNNLKLGGKTTPQCSFKVINFWRSNMYARNHPAHVRGRPGTVKPAFNDHRFKRPPAFSDRFFMHGQSAIQTALC